MKKFLALVLALVMTMSLVTISSSADFVDADSIEYDEAVNVLASLGVIQGKGGNTYDPKGGVTRAEMAKMITFIKLGVAEASAFEGTTTDLTDISGHWAESFIKFCYVEGIIAGKGNGKFDPDANVTTAEAAKMLLVALGYNAGVQGYVGDQWKVAVIRDAYQSDLFEDLSLSADKALNRDEAAKIIYNTVLTETIEQNPTLDITTGNVTIRYDESNTNLLAESFKASKFVGEMTGVVYNPVTKEYTYTDGFVVHGTTNGAVFVPEIVVYDAMGAIVGAQTSFSSAEDYSDLINEEVTVIAKRASTSSKYEVLGIFSTGKSAVLEDVESAFSVETKKIKLGGVLYATETLGVAGDAHSYADGTNSFSATSYDVVKVTDIDGNGKYDCLVKRTVTPAKVTYVDSTELLTSVGGAFKFADDAIDDGIAKGDYVYSYKNSYATDEPVDVVSKIEPFEAAASALHNRYNKVEFNSTWYNVTNKAAYNAGDTYRVWALHGVVFDKELVDGADVSNLVMVTRKDGGDWNDKVEYIDINGDKYTTSVDGKGNVYVLGYDAIVAGQLYMATKTSDGVEFSRPMSIGTTYTWDTTDPYTLNPDTSNNNVVWGVNGTKIADDAVVFVRGANGGNIVMTGEQIKTLPAASFALRDYSYEKSKASGLESRVSHLALTYTAGDGKTDSITASTGKEVYAYVTSDAVDVKIDNENHIRFTLWNGSENLEVYVKGGNKANYTKGTVMTYKGINDSNVLSGEFVISSAQAAAISTVEGSYVSIQGMSSYKVTGDTKYLYINSNAKEAADIGKTEAVALQVATQYAEGAVTMDNIVFDLALNNSDFEIIVVDVANNMTRGNDLKVDANADPYTDTTWAKEGDRVELSVPSVADGGSTQVFEGVVKADGKNAENVTVNPGQTVVAYATGVRPIALQGTNP